MGVVHVVEYKAIFQLQKLLYLFPLLVQIHHPPILNLFCEWSKLLGPFGDNSLADVPIVHNDNIYHLMVGHMDW